MSEDALWRAFKLVIPGSKKNSDLTIAESIFKTRLKRILLALELSGDTKEWSAVNFKVQWV